MAVISNRQHPFQDTLDALNLSEFFQIATIALLWAMAGGAFAEEFDSRDVMGGGPNFFRSGANPVPRTTVMYNGNYAPGTIVVNTASAPLATILSTVAR